MQVVKNDGRREDISFDKILKRIQIICSEFGLDRINTVEIAKETINGLYDGISTEEIDQVAAINCGDKIQDDPQYDALAVGLCVSRLHKTTSSNFLEVTEQLYANKDRLGNANPLITKEYLDHVGRNIDLIEKTLDYARDYTFDYFGFRTLEGSYLYKTKVDIEMRINKSAKKEYMNRKKQGSIIERPQHMFMRVALALNMKDLEYAMETYELLSKKYFIFGSPTLFNAGTPFQQMSSCFLLKMGDSLEQIYGTIYDIAMISKRAGGIGGSISSIRAKGSLIRGTNGESDGIMQLLRVLNETSKYVNQGGRRKGAFCMYLEPWHAEIFDFCAIRKNGGVEDKKSRDLFAALWIPDLFMKRVQDDDMWSLFCPDEAPGLTNNFGDKFEKLYINYEKKGLARKYIKARELWFHIISCQIETGMPFMLYKDNVNRLTNHANLGVIQSSNLCTEIVEYTDEDEIAVCNLSSICLPSFVVKGEFDYQKLLHVSRIALRNLNNVIDINYYPVDKAKKSNLKHRPVGVGVQGLADVFVLLGVAYESVEASIINRKIFETIYFGCLSESVELAIRDGHYESFLGSPFSRGELQYHLWGMSEKDLLMDYNWSELIDNLKKFGARNSLLTTIMPTVSTSQIMGNTEAAEPITMNIYNRSTLVGEFVVVNKYLVEKLIELNLWDKEMKDEILYYKGSVQKISRIPINVKELFKTAYEMKIKPVINKAIERGCFIDQSQSLNLFLKDPNFETLSSSHFYTWRNKLKTGMYYLRTQPAVDPIAFGLDPEVIANFEKRDNPDRSENQKVCTIEYPDSCGGSCSS